MEPRKEPFMNWTLRPYQKDFCRACVNAFTEGAEGQGPFGKVLAIAATGAGKCWATGTPMMLSCGKTMPVESLEVGQELLGPDSLPRIITSTNSGKDQLFDIIPKRHAEKMRVNAEHILVLKVTNIGPRKITLPGGKIATTDDLVEITVADYLAASKTARHCLKWIQTGFDLKPSSEKFPIPPWLLGFWLADGSSWHATIYKPGATKLIQKETLPSGWDAKKINLPEDKCEGTSITGGFRVALKELNLLQNKHIPERYKRASRAIRLEVLAGLLDGDGFAEKSGWEIVQKNKELADDILLVARSLGFAASIQPKIVKEETYWSMHLNGGPDLPLRRKKNTARRQKKDPLVTGFEVRPAGVGDYHGVTIDGPDRRLLMPDGTISHNTIMASALVWWQHKKPRREGRVLMLADTDELVQQAAEKIYQSTGLIPDIEKAAQHASLESQVVVGSIQTLNNRVERWPTNHFDLVIADEAHLSMAANWQKVLGHFEKGQAWILGITATPERGDGQLLMDFYEHIAAEINLFDLIEMGHLAPITVQVCPVEIDCNQLKARKKGINAGTFDSKQLEESIDPYLEAIIDEWQKHASDRQTLVFNASIKASKKFTGMLQERGISAAHVDGTSKDRKEILKRYERGEIQVLNNAQLLVKGYDCPPIACVINLRPTKSRTQYLQMIGRGSRKCEGKTDLLLLDFLWQFQELGMMRPAALIADGEKEKKIAEIMERGDRMSFAEASDEAEREREAQLLAQLKEARKKTGRYQYDARSLGAILHQPELIDYEPRANWEKKPISAGQKRFLEQQGVDTSEIKGLGHAVKLAKALVDRNNTGRATTEQIGRMFEREIPFSPEMSYSEAKAALQATNPTKS